MKKKNGKTHTATAKSTAKEPFDLNSLVAEDNIVLTPKSSETSEMYQKLDTLNIGQSFRMPMELFRIYTNAKVTHKRLTKKVFISRKLDSYNFRCWRLADDTILVTRQIKKKK